MANLIKEHNSQFNIGCARDLNYLDYNLKKKKPISAHLNPFHETAKGITKGKSISSCSFIFLFRKKILMAEEPSENPEHLSFKEKLKRFQNKEASPSGSVKVITVFNICLDLKQVSCSLFFLISFLFFAFFYKLNCISDIFQKL